MEPDESSGKWTREEDTPFAGWSEVEGGGDDFKPVSQSRTEGGGYGAAHIDRLNMDFDRLVSNAGDYMSAMHFSEGDARSIVTGLRTSETSARCIAVKSKAPLEGRAGPSSRRCRLQEGTNSEREEEEGEALSRCRGAI